MGTRRSPDKDKDCKIEERDDKRSKTTYEKIASEAWDVAKPAIGIVIAWHLKKLR